MTRKYLFYISQNYSFEILRPVQTELISRGDECAWFVEGNKINLSNFGANEVRLRTIEDAVNYNADAVLVPGNIVPAFIPGIKVQVFHGLEWKKKGHFRIRGFFDLYCTHGPITTNRFNELAIEHGHFSVVETGWPKLDPLFSVAPYDLETDKPVILFAPTFSPNLTCALECYDEIKRLAETKAQYWLTKFHPKMNPEWIKMYKALESDNFKVVEIDSCLPLLKRADVILSDTSSIISEFLLLGKPAVTYKNSKPENSLIDIDSPNKLETALDSAISGSAKSLNYIEDNNQNIHPYQDGGSAIRLIKAIEDHIKHPPHNLKNKPFNILRKLKLRKRLNYWKF